MSDRIAEIRERASKATPGPWYHVATDDAHFSNARMISTIPGPDNNTRHDRVSRENFDDCGCIAVTLHQLTPQIGVDNERDDEDGEFIAHARDDIPYLLAQLDAARAEVERLRAVVRRSAHSFNALELGRGVTVSRRAGKKWVVYYNSVSINDPPVRHEDVMDAINEALSFTPPVSPGDAPDCAKCGTTMVRSRDEHVCVNCGHKEKP